MCDGVLDMESKSWGCIIKCGIRRRDTLAYICTIGIDDTLNPYHRPRPSGAALEVPLHVSTLSNSTYADLR